eukprot:m.549016 g.549016  ORF g.549016 m.549016 type:complete len:113 (-) comp57721_c0_seq4:1177-1515(-)
MGSSSTRYGLDEITYPSILQKSGSISPPRGNWSAKTDRVRPKPSDDAPNDELLVADGREQVNLALHERAAGIRCGLFDDDDSLLSPDILGLHPSASVNVRPWRVSDVRIHSD